MTGYSYLNQQQINAKAAYVSGHVAREITGAALQSLTQELDYRDRMRVHEAILTADFELTWADPHRMAKTKAVAILASPVIIPVLAVLWTAWWIDKTWHNLRLRRNK